MMQKRGFEMQATSRRRQLVSGMTVLALGIGLSACTVTPPRLTFTPPSIVAMAPVRPPPPRVEVITAPPSHDYFWVYGHWAWIGNEHRWEDGHWERHREHAHWVAHRWEQDQRGQWALHEGYWRAD
jgi:hypothetical protein